MGMTRDRTNHALHDLLAIACVLWILAVCWGLGGCFSLEGGMGPWGRLKVPTKPSAPGDGDVTVTIQGGDDIGFSAQFWRDRPAPSVRQEVTETRTRPVPPPLPREWIGPPPAIPPPPPTPPGD